MVCLARIFVLLILTLISVALAPAATAALPSAGPNMQSPERFTPDSARIRNPRARERNKRLYDSIESKTSRRAVPRLLYQMLFVHPVLDTTANGQVLDETRELRPYTGKPSVRSGSPARRSSTTTAAGSNAPPTSST